MYDEHHFHLVRNVATTGFLGHSSGTSPDLNIAATITGGRAMRKIPVGLTLILVVLACVGAPIYANDTPAAATPSAVASNTEATPPPAEPKPEAKPAVPAAPAPPSPGSPFQLKIGDASVRFGVLFQPQVDFQQNNTGGTGQNFMVRRARFLVGGSVTKTVFFFFETENSRLGNANAAGQKSWTTGFQTLDAAVEWRPNKMLNLSGGLIRVPTSRDALESAATEFTIDTNSYAFTATGALMGTGGRDNGIMARGYFLDDRLEYRAAIVSGFREPGIRNSFRRAGRIQYNFFDKEVYNFPSYAGANFGKKKILAVGAAYDQQLDYHGMSADVFADIPNRFGSAIGTATYQRLDGNVKLKTQLPQSDIITIDAGLYLKQFKVGPWARYEQREFDATGLAEKRALVGLNYYPYGTNFNVKVGYGRFQPTAGPKMNQFVIQLQAFYY
jgi:hypothetical protein